MRRTGDHTDPPRETSPSPSGTLRSAESLRQDASWFFAAGALALALCSLLTVLRTKFSEHAGNAWASEIGMGMLLAASSVIVLWTTAFLKLSMARRAGLRSRLTAWADVGMAFTASVGAATVGTIWMGFRHSIGVHGVLAIPTVSVMAALTFRLIRHRRHELTRGGMGILFLALSTISFAYAVAIWLVNRINPLEFHPPTATGRPSALPGWGMTGTIVWLTLPISATCACVALRHVLRARSEGDRSKLLLFSAVSTWVLGALVVSVMVLWAPMPDLPRRLTLMAIVLALAAGAGMGWLLARWTSVRPSRIRTALFALPLAALCASILAPAACMFGACQRSTFRYRELPGPGSKHWAWHLPDAWRGLAADVLLWVDPTLRGKMFVLGFPSVAEIRKEALAGTIRESWEQAPYWKAWYERDPETALKEAAKSSVASGDGTTHGFGAGHLIGTQGDVNTVRASLQECRNREFIRGVVGGLTASNRRAQFFGDVLAACEANPKAFAGWRFLSKADSKRFLGRIETYINDPTRQHLACLVHSQFQFSTSRAKVMYLLDKMVASENSQLRKLGLHIGYKYFDRRDNLEHVLACATGTRPGTDDDERCMAAQMLCRVLYISPGSLPNAIHVKLTSPLLEEQRKDLARIVEQARRIIEKQNPGK